MSALVSSSPGHNTSLGGINTLALLAQDHLGGRAGYVQLTFDAVVLIAALSIIPAPTVAVSAVGAIVLRLLLITNHWPGRYIAG